MMVPLAWLEQFVSCSRSHHLGLNKRPVKIAEHLRARATDLGEPMGILRAGELVAHTDDENGARPLSTRWGSSS